ncbi:MAG: adenylate/guanylate cyclase domain-containing protein [Bacteroidales bacterium]|nr:adenylate/guanylate cyclase domain-containing protein [Bacteroidales bacterium]
MNLFFKSYKFYLFFFLTGLLKYAVLLGQDNESSFQPVPETIEFEIPSKYNKTPNTSFCSNDQGVYFIGKEDGFLTIDAGKAIFTPLNGSVYLARTANNEILYLTNNDFGYIRYTLSGGPGMISRQDMLVTHFPDYYPTGIHVKDTLAFLATTEGIFVVSANSANHFFFNRQPVKLHTSGNHVFLQAGNLGLFQWSGAEFVSIVPAETLNNKLLAGIIDVDTALLLLRREAPPLRLVKATGQTSPTEIEGINDREYESVHYLFDHLYLGKKMTNELVILSTLNTPAGHLTEECNLPGSSLASVFTDNFNDVWIISDFTIAKMEFPPRSVILDIYAQMGKYVISATFNKEGIYLATTNGIYLLESGENGSWTTVPIPGSKQSHFHTIQAHNNLVLATGLHGTCRVGKDTMELIFNEHSDFIHILDEHAFIAFSKNKLFKSSLQDGKWTSEIIDSTLHQIISHAECKQDSYILTGNNEIFRINSDRLQPANLIMPPGDSLNSLLAYRGGLLLQGGENFYSWDLVSEYCTPLRMSELQKILLSSDIIYSGSDHLWIVSGDATGGATVWKHENEFINTPYYEILAKQSFGQVMDIQAKDGYLWITSNKMLLRLDIEPEENQLKDLLRIQSVALAREGAYSEPRRIRPSEPIRYRKQSIIIGLTNLRFQKGPYPYYRYKLNHYQEEWSEWNRNSHIVIDNPWERKYTFEAQSVSSFGELSDPVTFGFTVTPPFYRTWIAYFLYILLLFTIAFLLYKWRLLSLKRVEYRLEEKIRERMKAVLSEKEKSDKLVADLFPKGTAEELKSRGRAKSKKFELVTVLFSDIQGFTRIAEEMNPEVLIDELDKFFFHFDSVVDKYNIEKIKTIGDAYMAAGGIPVKNSSNPVEVVLAGLEMQYYMKNLKRQKADIWDLRIGIHTGPVISGVVGHKKLSYDIWGDTVNTASRMESSGEGGKVNISGITYSLVKEFFICEYRGKLPVKYKGNIDMYFVTGLRPELSVDLHGIPNRRFFIKLQMLKIKDLEERVLDLIASNMALNLHFHKNEYIRKVCNQTELLGRSENVSDDELLLSQTAALMMFSGLSETYDNFENTSVKITREILPEYGYDEKQIDRICNLILATKEPFLPRNILESILVDAKMEYLGRSDYITQVKLLYLEKKNAYRDLPKEKFLKQQADLISNFNFFTLAAQRLREITPENQLVNLRGWK